jgi:hypothetical protein
VSAARGQRRWPLFLIASPAAVAVWSGWVGLGGLCGFGIVHPLPGIADSFQLNTAITLPVGVEAYGAYALGAWLTPGTPRQARTFARRSAIGALVLGMFGQVIYHLLAAAHAARAPWPVVMLVACLPVVTLGFGAALTHLLRGAVDPDVQAAGPEPVRAAEAVLAPPVPVQAPADPDARTDPDSTAAGGTGAPEIPRPRLAEVDRAAFVAELAGEIRAAMDAGDRWSPDYDALMARTGFRRSWCEKAVRDARTEAFRTAMPVPAARPGAGPAGDLGWGLEDVSAPSGPARGELTGVPAWGRPA